MVELLVVLAVTATLIGLSIYGITVINRTNRDTQRVEQGGKIKQLIDEFYLDNGRYPTNEEFSFSGITWSICKNNRCLTTKNDYSQLTPTKSSNPSTKTVTAYCYKADTAGAAYVLGVKTETGMWKEMGNKETATCANESTKNNFDSFSIPLNPPVAPVLE